MKRYLGVALLLLVGMMVSTSQAKADFYLGASYAQSYVSFDDISFDEDDSGFKGFVGFNFLKYFGIEGGYYDFGNPSDALTEVELSAWALQARGVLPLGDHFDLFAKVGYMLWDAEISGAGALEDDDFDLTYGAGFTIIFGDHVGIRGEYEILDVDQSDYELISLGVEIRF